MIRKLPVHKRTTNPDAQEMAETGGWMWVAHGGVSSLLQGQKAETGIREGQRARRIAARSGVDLKLLVGFRADVWTPHEVTGYPRDFNPEWLLDGADPIEKQRLDWEWYVNDWGWSLSPHLPRSTVEMLFRPNILPYCNADAGTRMRRIEGLVCDLRSAEYRRWAVQRAIWTVEHTGADGIVLGAKLGWMAAGSPALSTVKHDAWAGGITVPSTYGENEFEIAFRQLIIELSEQQIYAVTVHRPKRPQDKGAWDYLPEHVQDLFLGEYKGV